GGTRTSLAGSGNGDGAASRGTHTIARSPEISRIRRDAVIRNPGYGRRPSIAGARELSTIAGERARADEGRTNEVRERDAGRAVCQTAVGFVAAALEKTGGQQHVENAPAGLLVETPKALRLAARQAEAGHFEKLCADAAQHLLHFDGVALLH